MNDRPTYKGMILKYLQRYGKITDNTARDRIGTTRCSEYIRQLREEGYPIVTEMITAKNRYGRKMRYGVYRYVKE